MIKANARFTISIVIENHGFVSIEETVKKLNYSFRQSLQGSTARKENVFAHYPGETQTEIRGEYRILTGLVMTIPITSGVLKGLINIFHYLPKSFIKINVD